jgi:hypothetical protein
MNLGKPLPPSKPKPPDKQEVDLVIRNWNQRLPKYKGMLESKPYELREDEDSGWYWKQSTTTYVSKKGENVNTKKAAALITALLIGRALNATKVTGIMSYSQLATDLRAGAISLADWQQGMRSLISMSQETGILTANGGVEFMTQSDWSYLTDQINKQYEYLDKFASDIEANPTKWLNGRLDNRMRLYQESAYSAYQNDLRREAKLNGMDEERRVLGAADHCPGCLEQSSLGWQPIGTLDEIGDEECNQNCHCEFEYRNSADTGKEDNGE